MLSFLFASISVLILRIAVSLFGHSGEGCPPMFGDFEAQRHWMEITTSLPLREWYFSSPRNDLQYWGLDYPPLTAYASYLWGVLAERLLPELVQFEVSRGYETIKGKMFMRGSVIVSDVIVLLPALFVMCKLLSYSWRSQNWKLSSLSPWKVYFFAALSPALILIDHGHFQYNGVSIGLTIAAASAILLDYNCIGAILFSLSLNFKQMSLYHAPVFFVILFRKCIMSGWDTNHSNISTTPFSVQRFLIQLSLIGMSVIGTFIVLWAPFCIYGDKELSCLAVIMQIITRIFPFSRGIFEDKVANIWYLSSVIYDYRSEVDQTLLVRISLALTLVLLLPVVYALGRRRISPIRFLLGLVVSALAFFLASFQVHEKSLLLALVPASLLIPYMPVDMAWFQLSGCMTLFPLLRRDGQMLPYWACCTVFSAVVAVFARTMQSKDATVKLDVPARVISMLRAVYFCIAVPGVLVLHLTEALLPPPASLPDLYPALFAMFGCCSLIWYYIYLSYTLLMLIDDQIDHLDSKSKTN